MNWSVIISNIMTGGLLKGKRTALLAIASIVTIVAQYLGGDIGALELINQSKEQIILTLGILTAAASGNS